MEDEAMRGFVAVVFLAVLVWPTAAGASPSCEAEALRIAAEHSKVWRQAGNPSVVCGQMPPIVPAGIAGHYDAPTRTIYLRSGYEGAYNYLVAHELGHAWSITRRINWPRYAKYRGLDYYAEPQATSEDYADTFAVAMGEFDVAVVATAPPPYRFTGLATRPTGDEIVNLRSLRMLPRLELGNSGGVTRHG